MKSSNVFKHSGVILALVWLALSSHGCAFTAALFGPSNSVKRVELAQSKPTDRSAIIVVAARSDDPLAIAGRSVVLARYNPATKRANDCYQYDRAELNLPAGQSETTYQAFSVPPGTYVFPWHLGPRPNQADGFPAFIVRAGTATYVGEFILTPKLEGGAKPPTRHGFHLERDLVSARRTLGLAAGELELAETVSEPSYRPILCTI
jgi:hypothetical protein